jgi:cell wall assembly regulator SMI1
VRGQINRAIAILRENPVNVTVHPCWIPLQLRASSNTIRMADNPVEHSRTKHIAIRYHFLRDHQQKGDIEIAYINTKEQLADIFTKPLDEQTFNKLRHELNILDFRNFF